MKALTLTQPWATLVAIGAKRIETRSWATKYRGPLAIHAAKGIKEMHYSLCRTVPFYTALSAVMPVNPVSLYWYAPLTLGAIVATCNLIACGEIKTDAIYDMGYSTQEAIWGIPQGNELAFGDYTPGRFAWFLTDVKMLPEPIPYKGARRLWEWDGAIS